MKFFDKDRRDQEGKVGKGEIIVIIIIIIIIIIIGWVFGNDSDSGAVKSTKATISDTSAKL